MDSILAAGSTAIETAAGALRGARLKIKQLDGQICALKKRLFKAENGQSEAEKELQQALNEVARLRGDLIEAKGDLDLKDAEINILRNSLAIVSSEKDKLAAAVVDLKHVEEFLLF